MNPRVKQLLLFLIVCVLLLQFVLIPVELRLMETDVEKLIILILTTVIASILGWYKQLSIPKSLLSFLLVGLTGLMLASGVWAVQTALIWPSVVGWSMYLLLFSIGYSLPKEILKSKLIAMTIILVITLNNVQLAYFYLQSLIANDWAMLLSDIEAVPKVFNYNTNFVGSLMLVNIPVLIELAIGRWRKWLAFGNVMFIATLLPLFNSRAVTIALGLLVVFYLWRSFRDGSLSRYFIGLGIVACLVFLSYQSFVAKKTNYLRTYNPTRTITQNTADNRLHMWENSLLLFKERPLLGHGAGNWKTEVFKFGYNEYRNGLRTFHAHSLWFETLSELGLVGIILLLGLALLSLLWCIKTFQWNLIALILGLFVLFSFYGIYQSRSSVFSSWFVILLVWLGIVCKGQSTANLRRVLYPFLAIFIGVSLYSIISFLSFNRYLDKVAFADKTERKTILSEWENFGQPVFNTFRNGKSIDIHRANYYWGCGMKKQAVDVLKQSTKMDPHNWRSWFTLGKRYAAIRNFKKAAMCYRKSLHLYDDVHSSLRLTQIGLQLKNEAMFNTGIELYYKQVQPQFEKFYSEDYLVDGDPKLGAFWEVKCKAIDEYQFYLDSWESK